MSVVDGGKGEVFVQVVRAGLVVVPPSHVKVADVAERIAGACGGAGPILVVGEPAAAIDWSPLGPVTLVVGPPHDLPRATSVGLLALARAAEHADSLEPLYVRPPEITMPKPRGGAT